MHSQIQIASCRTSKPTAREHRNRSNPPDPWTLGEGTPPQDDGHHPATVLGAPPEDQHRGRRLGPPLIWSAIRWQAHVLIHVVLVTIEIIPLQRGLARRVAASYSPALLHLVTLVIAPRSVVLRPDIVSQFPSEICHEHVSLPRLG